METLLATFRLEATEHLAAISKEVLLLEREADPARRAGLVESIFREVHSLKGASRAVNFAEMESISHALEGIFATMKSGRLAPDAALFDLLHQSMDALSEILHSAGQPTGRSNADLLRRLEEMSRGKALPAAAATDVPPTVPAREAAAGGPGTIRVRTDKLDSVMRQSEELLGPRLAAAQRVSDLRDLAAVVALRRERQTKSRTGLGAFTRRVPQEGIAREANREPEERRPLEDAESESLFLKSLETHLAKLRKSAESDLRVLSGIVDGLVHDVKRIQMLPVSTLFEPYPRLVRDLARDCGKQVNLVIAGGEIEIDRRILEEMRDPLTHLVRNAVDHGIERPHDRETKGKPPYGTLTIAVSQKDSGKCSISVSDDGAGLQTAKVGAAARRAGVLSAEESEHLGRQEALGLIFRSGFTTSPMITEISGRGLGLAIVREKVERLGGRIEVEDSGGLTVRMHLPLLLAAFRGVLLEAGGRRFVVPAAGVERVARIPAADIRTVENRETISLGGKALSLVSLADVLELPSPRRDEPETISVVVLNSGPDRVAFRVDAVLAAQEVLVKDLGPQLARVRNVAGATVLGTGEVVPVLNVSDVVRSSMTSRAPQAVAAAPRRDAGRRSILVVEDSITSRTLLKNILQSAGYDVTTAVDGVDGYTALKSGSFDLVVSDVEMPRMDGFGLTARIRSDRNLASLPVVLVTALETQEHRERGIDVGANAYIVKSSFDQSNLLEVVRRLI
ncbi:MAG TPA: response regulator [Thermoanaerobaculia bacterium]|nr:response regulator [Thermoanaerobaculia bacterium]